ncbi:MAG: PQQ-binding-like beta-propeller repeat protein [Bryobacteraceae bacterium]
MFSLLLLAFAADVEWSAYGANVAGTRYSPAAQITKSNVSQLTIAWRYQTRGLHRPKSGRPSALETTPLYVDGLLYLTSALGRVAALDPATGTEKWSYDPKIDPDRGYGDFTNRGVSFYRKGSQRLILGVSIEATLFALDAQSGRKLWKRICAKACEILRDFLRSMNKRLRHALSETLWWLDRRLQTTAARVLPAGKCVDSR